MPSRSVAVLMLLLLVVSGCGKAAPKLSEPVSVTGKITLKGEPLGGATIGFNAIGSGIPVELRYVAGTTDKFGNYAIDKVYPSEYMVTVNKLAETASEGEAVSANPSIKELAAYSGSSPLRAIVTDAETVFNFDLK